MDIEERVKKFYEFAELLLRLEKPADAAAIKMYRDMLENLLKINPNFRKGFCLAMGFILQETLETMGKAGTQGSGISFQNLMEKLKDA